MIARVYYCILDGAEVNHQFIKLHFADVTEAIKDKFMTPNIYNGNCPMIFIMDPKVLNCHIHSKCYKPLLDEDFVISGIIKDEVSVISQAEVKTDNTY